VVRTEEGRGRILVLGGGGMLGHKVFQTLSRQFSDVWCTLRASREDPPWNRIPLFMSGRIVNNVDALRLNAVDALLQDLRPSVIVNCIGAIKQRAAAADAETSITLNSVLPHRIVRVAREWGGRLIHFSTDCVFSGRKGWYTETDEPDATDLYGRSKHLGEAAVGDVVTLRTSFIGRELQHHQSLLEWLLAQRHRKIRGFRRAWWSGLTSNHVAELVGELIRRHNTVSGLYNVSSGRISKYELLLKLRDGLNLDVDIEPDDTLECDRSLSGQRFEEATGYRCPSWDALIRELAQDPTPYETWVIKHGAS